MIQMTPSGTAMFKNTGELPTDQVVLFDLALMKQQEMDRFTVESGLSTILIRFQQEYGGL